MKTTLYIDGFNPFYGAMKGSPLCWLSPVALMVHAFLRNQITGMKCFFTAKVTALSGNPIQPLRQMIFWQALKPGS